LTQRSPRQLSSLLDQLAQVRARKVQGDFVECGIVLGGAAICIASQLDGARKFLGFNNGPAPNAADDEQACEREREPGIDIAAANLARLGLRVDDRRIRLVQGPFEDTLPIALTSELAFAHINLAQDDQVGFCLERLSERLSRFGVIVVSGYDAGSARREAVDAFLLGRDDIVLTSAEPDAILTKL
jgi:O-methyltransferase